MTIGELLEQARARLHRLTPAEAAQAQAEGAVIVDIRPAAQRATEGELPGALLLERTVLECRLDPTSEAALPVADRDLQVVVLCHCCAQRSCEDDDLQLVLRPTTLL